MKEESVFWFGGKPGAKQAATAPPAAAGLEPAIRAACGARGLQAEEFVAALGGHGSWLVSFSMNGCPERIVWNGKDRKLVLQRALPSGGWADVREAPALASGADVFTSAIAALLDPDVTGPR